MTGQKEGLYLRIFEKLLEFFPTLVPQIGMVDYKIAIRNSIKAVFPNIRVTGCRFHFGRAILKKIKAIGLQVEYINIPVVRIWSGMFISMCLLPANLIRPEVDKLKAEANHHSNIVVKEKIKSFFSVMKDIGCSKNLRRCFLFMAFVIVLTICPNHYIVL